MINVDFEPLYSIVIPVYNSEKYLHRCIQSILNQTYPNWNAIFVNDGSTDSSVEILRSYAEKDSRIRVISQSNGGSSAARNVGMTAVESEYFTFVDADDYISADFIERTLSAALESSCDLVLTGISCNGGNAGMYFSGLTKFTPLYFKVINPGPYAKLYKKSIVERHRIRFPEDMKVAEDYVFTSLYAVRVDSLYGIQDTLYYYCYESPQSLGHRFISGEMSYEQYQFYAEAPWRVYQGLLADCEGCAAKFISDCAAVLYSEFWRTYYISRKCVPAEDRRRLDIFFKKMQEDFICHVGLLRRIFIWQRYPRIHRWCKLIYKRLKWGR